MRAKEMGSVGQSGLIQTLQHAFTFKPTGDGYEYYSASGVVLIIRGYREA